MAMLYEVFLDHCHDFLPTPSETLSIAAWLGDGLNLDLHHARSDVIPSLLIIIDER